jgi:hypothetical protein
MAKLRLDIDTLRVQSFDTIVGEGAQGTVYARSGDRDGGYAAPMATAIYDCTPRTLCHNSCMVGCTDACVA